MPPVREARPNVTSDALYHSLVDHLPDTAVFVFDRDLRLVTCGGASLVTAGYDPHTMTGRHVNQLVAPGEAEQLLPRYEMALAGETVTFSYAPASSHAYLVDVVPMTGADGSVEKLLVVARDVSALRAEENARRIAQETYRSAFEEAPVGMAQADLDGRYKRVNPALCSMLGYDRASLEGSTIMSITHAADVPAVKATLAGMAIGAIRSHRSEQRLVHAEGRVVWVAVSARSACGSSDAPDDILVHYLDITDNKRHAASEERRRIARNLHDGLAHELAFIASRSRAATRRPPTVQQLEELAHAAERSLDEARRAITVLSSDHPEPLEESIAGTTEDLARRYDLGSRLRLDRNVDVPAGAREDLLRILREAITNAGRHASATTVTVGLDGHHHRLTVSDDGVGFDAHADHRGFGLVSMRERAVAIGADFAVRSAPGEGTTVEVTLP